MLNGLTLGGIYSLVALGLTPYGILHVPNFAACVPSTWWVPSWPTPMTRWGVNYWLAMLGAGVVVAVLAAISERLVFHPLRHESDLHPMIAAIGLLRFSRKPQVIWGRTSCACPRPTPASSIWAA